MHKYDYIISIIVYKNKIKMDKKVDKGRFVSYNLVTLVGTVPTINLSH